MERESLGAGSNLRRWLATCANTACTRSARGTGSLVPPLCINVDQIAEGLAAIEEVLGVADANLGAAK